MKYFTLDELKCKCGECGSTGEEMDEDFMLVIQSIREECNFPFIVSSAYRCSAYNARVSSGHYGAHTLGKAMDIKVSYAQAYKLLAAAIEYGAPFKRSLITGIGIKQNGVPGGRFIHLDSVYNDEKIPRPALWTY